MQFISLSGLSLLFLILCDVLWIGVIARNLYKTQMGAMLTDHVVWSAAVGFYIIYALALAYFVIAPAIEAHSFSHALLSGAFLGLAAFATYDLTGLATITNWPVGLSFIDMAWGVFDSALVSSVVYWIATRLLGF